MLTSSFLGFYVTTREIPQADTKFFETALAIALLHRLVYCFVISLRIQRIASINCLSKPAEVANFVVANVSKVR